MLRLQSVETSGLNPDLILYISLVRMNDAVIQPSFVNARNAWPLWCRGFVFEQPAQLMSLD